MQHEPTRRAGLSISKIIFILLFVPASALASDDMQKFFGYWHPADEEWCSIPRDEWETEGAQIIIDDKDVFFGALGGCEDVAQWMKGSKMLISAACRGEGGVTSVNGEFWIDETDTLYYKLSGSVGQGLRGYKRCPD